MVYQIYLSIYMKMNVRAGCIIIITHDLKGILAELQKSQNLKLTSEI